MLFTSLCSIFLISSRASLEDLVFFIVFSVGVFGVVSLLSIHEYDPHPGGIMGIIVVSLAGATIGGMAGHQLSTLAFSLIFCAVFTFLGSSSLSDLLNPANSFYKSAQIAPTTPQVFQYIRVSRRNLISIS